MNNLPETVLIGDPNEERFQWFKALLDQKYGKQAVQCKSLEELQKELVKNKLQKEFVGSPEIKLIFFSDDLPRSGFNVDPNHNFSVLQVQMDNSPIDFVCIVTNKDNPVWDDNLARLPLHVHFRSSGSDEENEKNIIKQLETLGGRLVAMTPVSVIKSIAEWERDNRTLNRQIRALTEPHDVREGETQLYEIIRRCLKLDGAEKLIVKQLGQGKSGASVFRLIVSDNDKTRKEYVLKLNRELSKLESEVEGHLKAEKTHKDKYTKHVAKIEKSVSSKKSNVPKITDQYIVQFGQWYAIRFDFLGGQEFGDFIDLETAIVASSSVLKEKTKDWIPNFVLDSNDSEKVTRHRLRILEAILDGLGDLWYSKKEFADRRIETVWKLENAPARESISLPPYQLTQRVKVWVQDFLDSHEALIGERLFPDWEKYAAFVLKLVADEGVSDLGLLNKKISFTLSAVHGDLNANNVLLWLKHDKYPFLIDLPFYQEDGHLLQDFVRLETEIKFALMDRQNESPKDKLVAFDYCVSQVPLWIEMENRLLDEALLNTPDLTDVFSEACDWKTEGFQDNVTLCYKMILLIRKKAFVAQQKILDGKPPPAPFADEYLSALLYHTIRSIGYPSLSVFKRLLAVYSSGSIIDSFLKR